MTDLPILYSFRRCPYAMRARMALVLSGVEVRLREIILRDKPEAMLAASAKGTVPVMVQPDGTVIDESLDLMMWALTANDQYALWPEDRAQREAAMALVAANDGDFKHHLDRYKYSTRYEDADAGTHRAAGAAHLLALDERLSNALHLMGDTPHLADIAIFPFVRQFRIADPGWFDEQPWDGLKRWLQQWMGSALFSAVMAKYPLWNSTGEEATLPSVGPTPFDAAENVG